MTRTFVAVIVLLVLCASGRADTPPDPAEAALREGRRHYDLQEWDAAIAKFKESYTLRPAMQPLFNIAQAYRLKGDCEQAVQGYKAYKRNYPSAPNIAQVDKFIVDMDACAKTKQPPPVEPVEPVEPNAPPKVAPDPRPPVIEPNRPTGSSGSGLRITGLVAGGLGVIAAGVGGVFAYKAREAGRDARELAIATPWDPAIDSRGETAERNARIFFAVGGAAIVTGAILYVVGARSHVEPAVTVVPRSGGAAAVWSCAF